GAACSPALGGSLQRKMAHREARPQASCSGQTRVSCTGSSSLITVTKCPGNRVRYKLWIWTHIFVRPKFPLDIPTVPPLPLHLIEESTGFMSLPGLVRETGLGQHVLHRGGGEAVEVTSVLSPFVK